MATGYINDSGSDRANKPSRVYQNADGSIVPATTPEWDPDGVVKSLFLTVDGTGAGEHDHRPDGSSETTIWRGPASGKTWWIHRLLVHYTDADNPASGKYGEDIDLTTGVQVRVTTANGVTVRQDLTDLLKVKTNAQWGAHCYDIKQTAFGAGIASVQVRWTFAKAGKPLRLVGSAGDRFEAIFAEGDDFTGLLGHHFKIDLVEVDEIT